MKDVDVLWLCTCQERPVGLVKAYDEIEECWKFYVGIGHGLDPEADVREIMRFGQKYENLGFLTEFCGLGAGHETHWISVEERLPKTEEDFLCAFDDGFIATASWIDGDWELWADAGQVTHWMPLPKPPTPEE